MQGKQRHVNSRTSSSQLDMVELKSRVARCQRSREQTTIWTLDPVLAPSRGSRQKPWVWSSDVSLISSILGNDWHGGMRNTQNGDMIYVLITKTAFFLSENTVNCPRLAAIMIWRSICFHILCSTEQIPRVTIIVSGEDAGRRESLQSSPFGNNYSDGWLSIFDRVLCT